MKFLKLNEQEATMTSLEIAEMTGKEHKNVIRDIKNEIEQIESEGLRAELIFEPSEYKDVTGRKLPCYKLNKKGVLQLGARYNAGIRYKLIHYIEKLEEERQPKCMEDLIIMQAQAMKNLKLEVNTVKEIAATAMDEVKEIREVIEINPKAEWRKQTNLMLNKISKKLGDYRTPKEQAYKALEERAKCKLSIRLKNLQSRAMMNGMAKSKVDNLNNLDVIANDPRLKEIYIVIVKELAIKHRVN
ncbi:MAG: Rha family transcriptional regulator [Anaeromicrobium sp.]|jgi:Rha family phage regulatory protein|uniref:Rha family transcriptional regulator n=1 Tax=Anaeromicrobium sp. TaxID=1929132 RepID=UPI0025F2758D|nr:Rha family transcriptional regulator [Anaeromicrobium sp.]MCT4593142.1 Rha family transcriptional regulator [Anaeromicrobium sp.]